MKSIKKLLLIATSSATLLASSCSFPNPFALIQKKTENPNNTATNTSNSSLKSNQASTTPKTSTSAESTEHVNIPITINKEIMNMDTSYMDKNNQYSIDKVVDGDTVYITKKDSNKVIKVRMYGIDTPETNPHLDTLAPKELKYGEAAKNYLKELLSNLKPETIYFKELTTDIYGRSVGIIADDNHDFNLLMVQSGLARVKYINNKNPSSIYYTRTDFQKEYFKLLKETESKAILKRAGFWAESSPMIVFGKN
ncbi:thermonuclease family protein [Mycoplasma sp. Ms02]|uniref:thermonuclease family protein n=1 Tax=Mycoplasma sp. Ms02 TaxID=353851 RepID=UPI001C897EAD|nr:thermonuclease family protein [Mycoplasma sp. Ms02]QZE12486.1 thermonuclease family protein [Mycoplasma sp. Ms02]